MIFAPCITLFICIIRFRIPQQQTVFSQQKIQLCQPHDRTSIDFFILISSSGIDFHRSFDIDYNYNMLHYIRKEYIEE